jgi:hypothetical protein
MTTSMTWRRDYESVNHPGLARVPSGIARFGRSLALWNLLAR